MARRFLVPIELPGDPGSALYAAPKQYVDTAVATRQAADTDLTAIAALAPADGSVLRRLAGAWSSSTIAEVKTALGLAKVDVGLSAVDNTSDATKPVSAAQQAALDLKQNELYAVAAVSSATTLTDTHEIVLVTTTSAVTVTLPTAVGRSGKKFLIKKIGPNACTIASNGGTIDGATTEVISMDDGLREVTSDGTNWQITGGKPARTIVASSVANGGTITLNAAEGTLFRVAASGATASLVAPTTPVDGDVVNVEINPAVALTLTITPGTSPSNIILTGGITSPISVPVGKVWSGALRFRNVAPIGWRLLASSIDN